jgi:hypothetical protein
MEVTLHTAMDDALAAAWDDACRELVVSPFQDRIGSAVRAASHDQSLVYAVGRRQGEVVFGAAISFRRRWPLPDRLTVTRGPWAVDSTTLLDGIADLSGEWQRRFGMPMSLHLDPHLDDAAGDVQDRLQAYGFDVAATSDFHPRTVQVNLDLPEDALRNGFRELTRRMLKKAEKEGVVSRFGEPEDINAYLSLHGAAAAEKGYGQPHGPWLLAAIAADRGLLVLTEHGGELIGGAFILRGPASLYYMYGATKPGYRGPASYHAMWHLMRWGRSVGIRRFDLGAVPEEHDGIAFFKRGFGGTEVIAMPEMELIYRPATNRLWQTIKAWRSFV